MANMIMASSSKSLIKSPSIPKPKPKPKPKQPSFSLPQFPLIPTFKSVQFPSLPTKPITIAAVSASLAAATPLPSLAAGFEKAAIFYFGPYLSILAAGLLFLLLECEEVYLDAKKITSIVKELPEVKQLEEQLAELRSAGWAAIVAMWDGRRDLNMVMEELMEVKEATARLSKQLTETYTYSLTRIRALKHEMDEKVAAEDIKEMWKELTEDWDELWDDW